MNPNTVSLDAVTMTSFARKLVSFSDAYHSDPAIREQADNDPHAFLAAQGMTINPEVEVRILANTVDTFYVTLPPDPNMELSDEDLSAVAGGKCAGLPLGTVSTVPSSASTLSTAH